MEVFQAYLPSRVYYDAINRRRTLTREGKKLGTQEERRNHKGTNDRPLLSHCPERQVVGEFGPMSNTRQLHQGQPSSPPRGLPSETYSTRHASTIAMEVF